MILTPRRLPRVARSLRVAPFARISRVARPFARRLLPLARIACLALLCAACTPAPIIMRDPATGMTTNCQGLPYGRYGRNKAIANALLSANCVDTFRAQGWMRVPQ